MWNFFASGQARLLTVLRHVIFLIRRHPSSTLHLPPGKKMANPALLQKKKGKYLWFSLLGLGFQPDTAISSLAKVNINVKHIHLGPWVSFLRRIKMQESCPFVYCLYMFQRWTWFLIVFVYRNMFDKPNKDASYIVIHFLLVKLNPTRFQETYRYILSLQTSQFNTKT